MGDMVYLRQVTPRSAFQRVGHEAVDESWRLLAGLLPCRSHRGRLGLVQDALHQVTDAQRGRLPGDAQAERVVGLRGLLPLLDRGEVGVNFPRLAEPGRAFMRLAREIEPPVPDVLEQRLQLSRPVGFWIAFQ